ncbi:MAG: hypothetical protein ACRCZP_13010, partial [Phycicoccus sp.]
MTHEYVGAALGTDQINTALAAALVPDTDHGDVEGADALVTESWVFGGHEKVRWYLTSTATPIATIPLYASGTASQNWEDTGTTVRGALAGAPAGASTLSTRAETATAADHDVCLGQWVSGAATRHGEISGGTLRDLQLTVARGESDAAADLQTRYIVYVVDSTGTPRPGGASRLASLEWDLAVT